MTPRTISDFNTKRRAEEEWRLQIHFRDTKHFILAVLGHLRVFQAQQAANADVASFGLGQIPLTV